MLTTLSILVGSLVMPCGSMINTYSTTFTIDDDDVREDSAFTYFNNFIDLRKVDLSFNVDNLTITNNLEFDLISVFNYKNFVYNSSSDASYDYVYSKKLSFNSVINSDYNSLITDFNYLSHLTNYDLDFSNFSLVYNRSNRDGINSLTLNCDLSISFQFSYRVSTSNDIRSFNVVNSYKSIFGESGFIFSTADFPDYNSIKTLLNNLKFLNNNILIVDNPISSNYDSFSYSFNYRELWRDSTQTAIDDYQQWYDTGIKDGYDKGFLDGQSSKIVANPINIAFNGIKDILDIEIFPLFKLSYALGFACMVMIIRFALSFFH